MNQTYATRVKAAASAVLLALLAACSGGDALVPTSPSTVFVPTPLGAGPTTTTTTAADITISGTAAVGAPLANAKVSILCNSGAVGKETNSDTAGKYSTTVTSACLAPYMLKVTGVDTSTTPTSTITLFAFSDKAGNINITPLTDIAAKFATNNDPDGEYDAVLKQIKTTESLWGTSTKAAAQDNLKKVLDKLGVTTTIALGDLLHGAFDAKLGDKTDDILEKLKKERGGVSLKDLVEQIANRGGSALTATERKPWLAFFPQQKSFTLIGTSCSGSYSNGEKGDGFISTNLGNASVTATFALTTAGFKVSSVISQAGTTRPTNLEVLSESAVMTTLTNVVAPDFVFATGADSFSVSALNNLLGFSASTNSDMGSLGVGYTKGASARGVTPQSFEMNTGSNGRISINCARSLPVITAASRPDFSVPARIASLAGTATSITSPITGLERRGAICRGNFAEGDGGGTFTYVVSPSTGDIKFNGKSLAANWFLGAYAYYSEEHTFDDRYSRHSSIKLNTGPLGSTASSPKGDLFMKRNFRSGDESFSHYCSSND